VIYLRTLGQSDPWIVQGTENAALPFFSPDGNDLGFFADGELRRIPLAGGLPVMLAAAPNPRGAVWLEDGTIVYSPEFASGLWQVPAAGGTPRMLIEPDFEQGERTFRWPAAVPGYDEVLFIVGTTDSPNSYDQATIAVFDLERGRRTDLLKGANMVRFVAPDRLVFSLASNLYAAGFDPDDIEMLRDPVLVKDAVGGDPSSGATYFDVSGRGDLVWVAGVISDARADLAIVGEDGDETKLPLEPRGFHQPMFSPDGSEIAFSLGRGAVAVGGDVWVYSFADDALRRVTFGGSDGYPLWYPDGSRIAFLSTQDSRIISKPADGTGEEEVLIDAKPMVPLPGSWSPDGRTLAYTRVSNSTDVYLKTIGGDERLIKEDAAAPMISPDGRWLAYASPASGSSRIFVEPLEGEGLWQISTGAGGYPRWSPDGRRLYFIAILDSGRPLMEVDVTGGDTFRCGKPRVVIDDLTRFVTHTAPMMNWDTDGERFAFVELRRDEDARLRFEVALDWARQLDKLEGR
jgi:serine/threonine-protein kinase